MLLSSSIIKCLCMCLSSEENLILWHVCILSFQVLSDIKLTKSNIPRVKTQGLDFTQFYYCLVTL